jgi:hypothetical protein
MSAPRLLTNSSEAVFAVVATEAPRCFAPGAHGPVAAFGLDTLRFGAAKAGVHGVDGA